MISQELRSLIVCQLKAGKKVPELVPICEKQCSRSTLYRVAKEFAAGVEEKEKKQQKRPWKKIDPLMAATILRRLTIAKTHHSIRSVARGFKLSEKSVRNLLKKKKQRCFKKRKRNLIPRVQQRCRKICCLRFQKRLRKFDIPNILFVDECYVTVQKSFNHQNERCYGKDFALIPDWKKFKQLPKTPLSAMVFGGVSRNGRTPLVVLPSGFRLNQETYKEECVDFVKKNLPHGTEQKKVIFYQDKAPCHAAKSVQEYLKISFPAFIPNTSMPPNSPDLNVLDYCVWSLLKERLNKYGHIASFKRLKEQLQKEWKAIPQEAIQHAVDAWQSRVRLVAYSTGGHIGKKWFFSWFSDKFSTFL